MNNYLSSIKIISSQSADNVRKEIIQSINLYENGQITLRELINKIKTLKTRNHSSLHKDIENALSEISSLSIIDDILTDILNELETNKKI